MVLESPDHLIAQSPSVSVLTFVFRPRPRFDIISPTTFRRQPRDSPTRSQTARVHTH